MTSTLLILAISIFFFIQGKIRSDVVAACSLLALLLSGTLTTEESLSGFSSPIVIMMGCVFIIGGAIAKTGLAKMISAKILVLAGKSEEKLFFLIMLTTAGIGAFVSNSGTVAVMMPVVVSLAASAKVSPSRFLMPIAFASTIGGMLTLIGSTSNIVINKTLHDANLEVLQFFSFSPVGLVCIILGAATLAPLSKKYLSRKPDESDTADSETISLYALADKYHLTDNIYPVKVRINSPIAHIKLRELNLSRDNKISIVEIRRHLEKKSAFSHALRQIIPDANFAARPGDILYLMGTVEHVTAFVEANSLEPLKTVLEGKAGNELDDIKFDAYGIAELVLLASSKLVDRKVEESCFREKFSVNVLGIQRRDEQILAGLKDEVLQAGDAILVQGDWKSIRGLEREQSDWVVVGQPFNDSMKMTLDHKAPLAACITLFMVVLMAFNVMPSFAAAMLAAVLLIITGCFRNAEEACKTINWESLILIAAMLPMSVAIEKSGATNIIATFLAESVGQLGPLAILGAIYFGTSILTMFISNTATAVLFAPIALHAAQNAGVSPYPFLLAVSVSSSMCFASPFSTPANALVMSAGRYNFMDFIKVGLPLQILFGIVLTLVLPLIFKF